MLNILSTKIQMTVINKRFDKMLIMVYVVFIVALTEAIYTREKRQASRQWRISGQSDNRPWVPQRKISQQFGGSSWRNTHRNINSHSAPRSYNIPTSKFNRYRNSQENTYNPPTHYFGPQPPHERYRPPPRTHHDYRNQANDFESAQPHYRQGRQPPPANHRFSRRPPGPNNGYDRPHPQDHGFDLPPPPHHGYSEPPTPPQPPHHGYGPPPPPSHHGYSEPPPPHHAYGSPSPPPPHRGFGPPPLRSHYGYGPPPPPRHGYGSPLPPSRHGYLPPTPPHHGYGPPPPHFDNDPLSPPRHYSVHTGMQPSDIADTDAIYHPPPNFSSAYWPSFSAYKSYIGTNSTNTLDSNFRQNRQKIRPSSHQEPRTGKKVHFQNSSNPLFRFLKIRGFGLQFRQKANKKHRYVNDVKSKLRRSQMDNILLRNSPVRKFNITRTSLQNSKNAQSQLVVGISKTRQQPRQGQSRLYSFSQQQNSTRKHVPYRHFPNLSYQEKPKPQVKLLHPQSLLLIMRNSSNRSPRPPIALLTKPKRVTNRLFPLRDRWLKAKNATKHPNSKSFNTVPIRRRLRALTKLLNEGSIRKENNRSLKKADNGGRTERMKRHVNDKIRDNVHNDFAENKRDDDTYGYFDENISIIRTHVAKKEKGNNSRDLNEFSEDVDYDYNEFNNNGDFLRYYDIDQDYISNFRDMELEDEGYRNNNSEGKDGGGEKALSNDNSDRIANNFDYSKLDTLFHGDIIDFKTRNITNYDTRIEDMDSSPNTVDKFDTFKEYQEAIDEILKIRRQR